MDSYRDREGLVLIDTEIETAGINRCRNRKRLEWIDEEMVRGLDVGMQR